ncbi:M23 family metallopeptidase [Naumannella cuiyingiana]|uniref:LasA protease n=1 Tax=Naumannella cuiyingiana TaxID=1347891 RepID=A0A7Z0DAI7_9ACTN|nr:M23 family peptidase [Naumannella cuiyingiana]NYI71802.1 hypothetical protein [Naumannella cuiyingiana]
MSSIRHSSAPDPAHSRGARLALVVGALAALGVPLLVAGPAAADDTDLIDRENVSLRTEDAVTVPGAEALGEEVLAQVLERTGGAGTPGERLERLAGQGSDVQVRVSAATGDWAEGVSVVTAQAGVDAMPEAWVYLARQVDGRWTVALEGDPQFADFATESATLDDEARDTLSGYARGARVPAGTTSTDLGMQFPVKKGTWFNLTGGPHGWSGSGAEPQSSIDLSGSDGTVRSARGGRAYVVCSGMTRVIHNNGFSTDYYHMWNQKNLNGGIGQDVVLGTQGTNVTCGGIARGAHLHFAIRSYSDPNAAGKYVDWNGYRINNHEITGGNYSGKTVDVTNGNVNYTPARTYNY